MAYLLEGPNSENNFSDDLFLGYATQGAAAVIYGFGPVIAHDKNTVLTHSNRFCKVTLIHWSMVILLEIYIAFIQRLLIYINDPIPEINSDRLTFRCNDTLDEALAIAEGILTNHDNITLLGVVVYGAAGQKKNVTIYQRLVRNNRIYSSIKITKI